MSPASPVRIARHAALAAAASLVIYDVPHFVLGTDVREAAGRPLYVVHGVAGLVALIPVSYTHLTLPTIYSV